MAYLGLARKWRPQIFADLVGQEHIAQTILNAIKKSRISQGYLFTGTRGIGKTSAARIFAKALRCPTPVSPGVPCNKCNDCVEISEGRSIDVLEIDGASNNGVDAVREIRENAKYLPSTGTSKIYIIDEVHMLTTAAFNALLKTLEEPPAHVIFVFATTDPQKIPDTVLSRCQRFDFKRVSQKALQERLKEICDSEKIKIAADALAILSREAEGSMRDAVSLLDQVISIGGEKEISANSITNSLGLVDKQTVLDCVTGVLKRQPLLSLEAVGKIHLHGFDLKQFGREVLRYLRVVMLARLLNESKTEATQYLDVSDVDLADVKELLNERSIDDLDMLFRMLSHGLEEVARSSVPKMIMDVLFIKMAASVEVVQLSEMNSPQDFGSTAASTPAPAPVKSPERVLQAAAAPTPKSIPAPSEFDVNWWKSIVAYVKSTKPLFGSMLEHLGFSEARTQGEMVVITISYTKESSFHAEQLQSSFNRDPLAATIKTHVGRAVRLDYVESLSNNESLAQIDEGEKRDKLEERKRTILASEAFQATEKVLGAKLEKLNVKSGREGGFE